jgi:protein O-GlcNAc transferase
MSSSSRPPTPAGDPLLAAQAPLRAGDFASAAAILDRVLAARPQDHRGWGLLARCRRLLGDIDGAERAVEQSLRLQPAFVPSLRERALLRAAQGRTADALDLLEQLVAVQPDDPSLAWELAVTAAPSAPERALAAVQRLRGMRPDDLEPQLLQAQIHRSLGQPAQAKAVLSQLLQQQPAHAAAIEALYWAEVDLDAPPARRLELATRLASSAPTPGRWLRLGQEQIRAGDFPAAHAAIAKARALDPTFLPARWAGFCWPPTIAPQDDAAVAAFKARWRDGLSEFEALDPSRPEVAAQAWDCVGQCTAFYRHYLGDTAPEQRRFGALVSGMLAPVLPPAESRRPRQGRRRVGICSSHLREHTVGRLFAPLIEHLGRADLDLHVFALEPPSADWLARLQAVATVHGGPRTARGWRDAIADTALDVLLYPEVGMDALTHALAATRLAPVQAALWGHPVTTGLPSIDYMLSPQAMEPAGAEADYSERLLRLPGLGHGLELTDLPAPQPFALPPPAGVELLCAQTVYKLLPAQDRLFARILAARPQARLHLLADHRPPVQDWLRARMTPALAAAGADPERQLLIHGLLPLPQFYGLAEACRLNLDSIGWSGGMSSLDLLAHGLPTLTLPGATMRSRQTAALLQTLELPELIAIDEDDYVARALALIDDDARCAQLRASLKARRQRLFAEPATPAALLDFVRNVGAGA